VELGYFGGYEKSLAQFVQTHRVSFQDGPQVVEWEFHHGDFPTWVAQVPAAGGLIAAPPPHAILFDAYSPARNPAMWTLPLFSNLFQRLDPQRPCALPTYSRSTILRVTLLVAGFYVGVGHPTGEKEETTIAANKLDLITEPLNARWLERALRSDSAEPLREPVYSRASLTPATADKLRRHPQFYTRPSISKAFGY
jgi:hypothetical protein